MAKLLFLLLCAGIAYWWWRKSHSHTKRAVEQVKPVENMVRCVQCGVHLPQNEALGDADAWFCSAAHAREYASNHTS
ncbi:MAG: PP0621 family protein [Sulfuriferula sp.]